jgi:hypothetical protein
MLKKLTLALWVNILTQKKINKSTQISELFMPQKPEAGSMVQDTLKHLVLINLYSEINVWYIDESGDF